MGDPDYLSLLYHARARRLHAAHSFIAYSDWATSCGKI